MTMDTEQPIVVTDFLLEVTQAVSYQELAKAYKRVEKDFEKIKKQDNIDCIAQFIRRYHALAEEATQILDQETNGNQPSVDQVAIFGEMVILRDFCFRRIQSSQ